MKKPLPLIVLLCSVLAWLVLDRGMAMLFQDILLRSDYRASRIYSGSIDSDVVIVGNSRAVHLTDVGSLAKDLCRPVYNLGLDAVDATTQNALIRDYLDLNEKPDLLVIEGSNIRPGAPVAPEYLPYFAFSERLSSLAQHDLVTRFAVEVFHLYSFNSPKWWRALMLGISQDDQDQSPYFGSINEGIKAAYGKGERVDEVDPAKLADLVGLVRYARAKRVNVVVLLAPFHEVAFKTPNARRAYVDLIRRQLPPGVDVIDMTAALGGDAPFADIVHVNNVGVERLTPILAAALQDHLPAACGQTSAAR